jgi:16S rRNA (uracil1498-N3)-methyltransferase
MRKIRLYQQDNFNTKKIILNSRNYHYLTKVLRFKLGEIILFNGDGYDYIVDVTREKNNLIAQVKNKVKNNNESRLCTTLIQGIAKSDKMDYIIQKATELGVNRIMPIITSRVVVKLNEKKVLKKQEHWQEVAVNAAEQCERAVVPIIDEIKMLNNVISENFNDAFVLHHKADKNLTNYQIQDEVAILVGPEGGLSADEIHLAISNNFKPLLLGSRVLRTETASLVALANLQLLFGS